MINNYNLLFKEWYKIIPTENMSKNEVLNSLIRFGCILALIFIFIRSNTVWFLFPMFILVSCFLLKIGGNNDESYEITCKKPSFNNPFMNNIYGDKNKKLCENYDRNEIDNLYRYNLYRNINDVFGKHNLKMQFYTKPVTNNVNDTRKAINLLYNTGKTCKYDGVNCLKYKNLKFH